MSTTQSKRRTAAQWQTLIEKWQHSTLSAARFCSEHNIGYASFCQWRKKLLGPTVHQGSDAAEFLDLSALAEPSARWQIVLALGNGVELRLSQG